MQRIGLAKHVGQVLVALGRIGGLRCGISGGAEPPDRRAQVVRKQVRDHPKLVHQRRNSIQHLVDPMAEAIEGVAIAGELHAPAEVESRDAVGDRDDPADALADIIGKDHAAHRAEQDRDDQRDQKRPLDGLAKSEAVADGPAVDQPFAVRKPMQLQRCLLRRGLPPEAQQSVAEAVAERVGRPRDCRQIADPLLSRGIEERDRRLRIAERIAVVDRILERRHPAGPMTSARTAPCSMTWPRRAEAASSCVRQ